MSEFETGIVFTPDEEKLLRFQEQITEEWGISPNLLGEARRVVEEKKRKFEVPWVLFSRKRNPVKDLHHVRWEELVEEGKIFGERGRMSFTPDGEKVICHLCGNEYVVLSGRHLNAHGLEDGDEYRELLGLNRNQPLAAPRYSERRRKTAIGLNTAKHFIGKGEPFREEVDERREKRKRLQCLLERKDRHIERREKGELWPGRTGLGPQHRALNHVGRFKVNGKSYFFSKRSEGPVEVIRVTDDEIVVKGTLRDGTKLVKRYSRKR
jgi:hypothetical protein